MGGPVPCSLALERSGQPFEAVGRKSKPGRVEFTMHPHPVHHLLVEDWDPGLGLISAREGNTMTYKPSIVPGAIFVRGLDGHGHLAVSPDTRRAVNKTFSHLGTRRMHEKFKRYRSLTVAANSRNSSVSSIDGSRGGNGTGGRSPLGAQRSLSKNQVRALAGVGGV